MSLTLFHSYITMFFVVVVQLVGIWKSTLIDIKELALDEEDEPQVGNCNCIPDCVSCLLSMMHNR